MKWVKRIIWTLLIFTNLNAGFQSFAPYYLPPNDYPNEHYSQQEVKEIAYQESQRALNWVNNINERNILWVALPNLIFIFVLIAIYTRENRKKSNRDKGAKYA